MEPKFNLDRPKVSDEEINKHKDFDNLVKQFKEQSIQKARNDASFLKNKKVTYASVIAGITVICTLTYLTVFKDHNTKTNTNDKIATTETIQKTTTSAVPSSAFIAPPSSKINVPYSKYKVNAVKGGELAHHTHSKIKVPKNAFVNKKGEDIIGEVEIEYREFHNQADIIASGIPMTYDSAGTRYHFESAGMFDVKGTQNGEPVFIKPDKSITVELASQQPADHFNQYVLDTVKHNWTCLKRDKPQALPAHGSVPPVIDEKKTENATTKALEEKIAAIPPKIENEKVICAKKIEQLPVKKPVKPLKANSGRPQFELDVDYKEFPELAAFKNAVFEVGEENKNYTSELSKTTWSEAKVSTGPDKGKNYLVTLKKGRQVEKLIVYPVLSGADYDKALKNYDDAYAKRMAEEKKLQDEMLAKQQAYMEEQKKLSAELVKEQIRIRQQMEQQLSEEFNTIGNIAKVTRVFQVSRFGVFNSDCPSSMPSGPEFHPVFAYGNSPSLIPNTVFMVEHGRNIVFNFSGASLNNMRYDPSKDYSLCVVVKQQLYFYSKDQFKEAMAAKSKVLNLTAVPESVDNVSDFRKSLGI
ncbi:MAG: hypothetical protein ACXVPQ_04335 [Bacteroidia bacterium]